MENLWSYVKVSVKIWIYIKDRYEGIWNNFYIIHGADVSGKIRPTSG